MKYSEEDLCEDVGYLRFILNSEDYAPCDICHNHVHIDDLDENSVCIECEQEVVCKVCGTVEVEMKHDTDKRCRTCIELFEDLEVAKSRELLATYIMFVVLGTLVITFLLIASKVSAAESGKSMTKRFEGYRATAYKCPSGKPTIGYGFNMLIPANKSLIPVDVYAGKRPMTQTEADAIFDLIYSRAESDARVYLGTDFDRLTPMRQAIIVDMSYSLGLSKLQGFRKLKAAIVAGDFDLAANEIKNSLWYSQTGQRGRHHVEAFR